MCTYKTLFSVILNLPYLINGDIPTRELLLAVQIWYIECRGITLRSHLIVRILILDNIYYLCRVLLREDG